MQYSPTKLKEKIKEKDFVFKKKYGQNFIVDENIIDSIISKANIDKDTLVIEIGPGSGALTYKLSKVAKDVLAYEIDKSLNGILKENLNGLENVDIIFDDFLKRNVIEDIKKYNYYKLYVVANLPYYITTPIIVKFIEEKISVDKIVVMVQKEVGDRFRAKPGSKEYGSLSIYLDYYFSVKKILDVSKNVFIPKPNVDSIVVEFEKKDMIYKLKNEDLFFSLVRSAFRQKRKTLKNNLKDYDLIKIGKVLEKYNYDLNTRAEQLSTSVFIDLANELSK